MDKEELKKLTGLRIKELRKSRGLTQEKLAELTNICERNLSKIECGQNFVSAETLLQLAIALNIEPFEIFQFAHLKDDKTLRNELIAELKTPNVNVSLLYKLYKTLSENGLSVGHTCQTNQSLSE